jgi:hypothetical protein
MKWVFGCKSMAEVHRASSGFVLEGVLENMRCPFLILHGGHDVLLRFVSTDETGAEHTASTTIRPSGRS